MHRYVRPLLLSSVLTFMACGHAQILDQSFVEPRGGVLALVGAEDKAMEDAEQKMAAHCGAGKFRVERRTMAVTGVSTVSTTQTDYGEQENDQGEQRELSGGETQSTITESQETRELRISYACTQ